MKNKRILPLLILIIAVGFISTSCKTLDSSGEKTSASNSSGEKTSASKVSSITTAAAESGKQLVESVPVLYESQVGKKDPVLTSAAESGRSLAPSIPILYEIQGPVKSSEDEEDEKDSSSNARIE